MLHVSFVSVAFEVRKNTKCRKACDKEKRQLKLSSFQLSILITPQHENFVLRIEEK
jgi:hypothetical protein